MSHRELNHNTPHWFRQYRCQIDKGGLKAQSSSTMRAVNRTILTALRNGDIAPRRRADAHPIARCLRPMGVRLMNHHTARLIACRTNGIGRRLGCACCNAPRKLIPTFARTVRTKIKRVGAEEIDDALAPVDPNADVCDGSCPDCSGRNDLDVEPVHFNDEDGDRWRFPDGQPYCDAP